MRGTPDNDHPDALIRQPLDHTVQEVLFYIERLRPQVVVTDDPWGAMTNPARHPLLRWNHGCL